MAGIVLFVVSSVFAYSGGSGTSDDPYQIGTVADWNDLMNTQSDWDVNFIMTADINLQGVPLIPVGNDINYIDNFFSGVFDGNGHTIRNATINMPGYWHIGLFGIIIPGSQIRNLGVEDVNMSGTARVGGLVGYSNGIISNCYATGKVNQSWPNSTSIGGLAGKNDGTITGSHAACDVNGITERIGGLVGWNIGTITDSYANGTVNGYYSVGGLVGDNMALYVDINYIGSIARCYATGSVSGYGNVGGLVGMNGDIHMGFVGWCSVTDCYATGAVTGTRYVGGLVGYNFFGHVTDCYAAGMVSGDSNVGGLIGHGRDSSNSFWDMETSGQTNSKSGTGKTTAEMMTLSTFASAGWDFINETANGPNDIWFIREGKEYPRFVWENNKPIADAGPNQVVYAWIDGIVEVTLDANNSYDADGDELTYLWKWLIDGNTYETNEVNPTIDLPVGQWTFELVLSDGIEDSEPNQVVITVIEPIKSTLCIAPKVINRHSNEQRILAMLRLPAGITRKQINPRQKLLLYPGEIESSFQLVLPCGRRDAERLYIIAYFDKSELMDAVGKSGKAQLDVVGQLKTGQYFYGSDTVWIINPPPRRPNWYWWGRDFAGCDR
jgi:hypothetical protein